MRRLALLLALCALLPALARAQGLGEVAEKQRQKREAQKTPAPARSYGNDDLPTPSAPPAAPDASAAPGEEAKPAAEPQPASETPSAEAAAPAAEVEKPAADPALSELDRERDERRKLESEWRLRFAKARERLAAAEENAWQEVIRTEYYQGIPVQMRVKEQTETPELRQARQAVLDLEDEFRRTGLPPGWARP